MREINTMEELKIAQQELRHQREIKEIEIQAHLNALKEFLNPITYINYAISRMAVLEQFVAAIYKGYSTIRDMAENYRTKKEKQQTNITPDNNQ